MKGKRRSGRRLLTFILALAIACSSLSAGGAESLAAAVRTENTQVADREAFDVESSDSESGVSEKEETEEAGEEISSEDQDSGRESGDTEQPENDSQEAEQEAPAAEAVTEQQRKLTIRCENPKGEPSDTIRASASPEELYAGTEVTVTVVNDGDNLWAARITANGRTVDAQETEDTLVFEMPDADTEVLIYEIESREPGELSEEDSSIPGDFQGNQSVTEKENEPDIELHKSARWTNIEDGYAELTITEKDTSDYSNIPTDYIIILDRTRTMSLSDLNHELGSGKPNYMGYHSPCINPAHYYYKGGIYLHMVDYFTGYDYKNKVWFNNLPGDFDFWDRHYNENDKKIMPTKENGCYDRLSMAQAGIKELVDRIAQQNEEADGKGLRSRVAFWSFASDYNKVTGDKRDLGLYNYTPLTEDYDQVKKAVDEVKTYPGTYYMASLQEAYDIITGRNAEDSQRKNLNTKIIFISDGECETDLKKVKSLADNIRNLPSTELFTLAIGMTADSDGARLLKELAGSEDHTANFWQTLSFDGEKGSAFAKALLNIEKKAYEVKAVQKVLTDQIETRYWEPIEVVSADGGNAVLDPETGKLTWEIPEGAGETWHCTVRLRLKDAYRYQAGDAVYPTNRDKGTEPDKAGALLDYRIEGGMYHQQERQTGVSTPELKYGTVRLEGRKNWTVSGSRLDRVTVRLMRTWPGQSNAIQVNNAVTNASRRWSFSFSRRAMPNGTEKPLVKYDERGRLVTYEVTEKEEPYYRQLETATETGTDGNTVYQLYNEPFKVKAQLKKIDGENKKALSGAVFSVYTWSRKQEAYVPYRGTTDAGGSPYETGSVTGSAGGMILEETGRGIYQTPGWLYYAPDNEGRFRIIESQAPEGYCADGKAYDFVILAEKEQNQTTIVISNQEDGSFANQRMKGKVIVTKIDREADESISQGDAVLSGAQYGLFADGKPIPVRFLGSQDGVRRYSQEPDGNDTLTIGVNHKFSVENLELGTYTLKEKKAGEGYLKDPSEYSFTLTEQGEAVSEVELSDYRVYDRVKKQQVSFCKVTGTDEMEHLEPLAGAGFSVYLLSELDGGKYKELTDEEAVRAIIEDFRDGEHLDYRALKKFCPARVWSEKSSAEIKAGMLVKKRNCGDGYTYQAEGKNEYLVGELFSDSQGIVTTPGLPYGRYLIVETTVPRGRLAARPLVVTVAGDDRDRESEGDGLGEKLESIGIVMDRPTDALVRIRKIDRESGETIPADGASYVIHDKDGVWFSYYTADFSQEEKAAYREAYGDLVVQDSEKTKLGSRENPFTTRKVTKRNGEEDVYVDTPEILPAGAYELEEITAPKGYILQGKEGVIAKKTFGVSGNGTFYETEATGKWKSTPQGSARFVISVGEAVYDSEAGNFIVEVKQKNEPAVGKISIYAEGETLVSAKKEQDGYAFGYEMRPIAGAEFELRAAEELSYPGKDGSGAVHYAKGELVATLVTDEKGQTWTGQQDYAGTEVAEGLPLGTYTVTQTKAGEGFALSRENQKPRTITIAYAGQEAPVIYRDTAYTVPRQKVRIAIEKQDQDTGEVLSGAVFGLYTEKELRSADGKLLVKADTLIGTAETLVNPDGPIQKAVFASDIPVGSYYVKELQAPAGYKGTDEKICLDASWRTDEREIIELEEVVKNKGIHVQVNLMDYFTEKKLSMAVLEICDDTGKTVWVMTTAATTNATLDRLEPGKTYTVKLRTKKAGYGDGLLLKQDYVMTPQPDSLELGGSYVTGKEEQEVEFTVLEDERLQVLNLFAKPETGALTIKKEGPVPVGTKKQTDENGNLRLDPIYEETGLPGAEYVLVAETQIRYPDGSSGVLFEKNDLILETYEETRRTGAMQHYEIQVPKGNGELIKAERFLPDGRKASLVLRTGADGSVRVTGLPVGSYRVVEVKAPTGYYRDSTSCTQMADINGNVEVLFENPKQELEKPGGDPTPDPGTDPDPSPEPSQNIGMLVQKYGVDGEKRSEVPGAAFTLYAAEDIRNIFGTVIYPEGTEIETAISGEKGLARFLTDVPIGLYRIRETKAPEGYYSSKKEIVYNVAKDKDDDSVHYLNFYDFVENAPTEVNIRLRDDLTHNELSGAALEITDEAGKSVDAWITKVENGYTIKGLSVDKWYTITENMPREGYLVKFTEATLESGNASLEKPEGQKVRFRLTDVPGEVTTDGKLNPESVPEPTRILLENPFVTGNVRLNKEGEVLESWTLTDKLSQLLGSVFGYQASALSDVEFAVYAAEDIVHPDGVTGICFRKGELVMTGVRSKQAEQKEASGKTDRAGILSFEELYLGRYEIREKNTAEGYVRETDPIGFTLAYVDGFTSPVEAQQGEINVTNPRQKVEVTVWKQDADTLRTLEGAEIGLYTAEEICNRDGISFIPADTLLELGQTDEDGKILFTSDLPLGRYYVKEVKAPKGYLLSEEKQELEFSYAGQDMRIVELERTILNKKKPKSPDPQPESSTPTATLPVPTGDSLQTGFYLALFFAALATAGTVWMEIRKRKR